MLTGQKRKKRKKIEKKQAELLRNLKCNLENGLKKSKKVLSVMLALLGKY